MRGSEFLRKKNTGIPNIANQNSNFLTLQTSEFQKKNDRNLLNQKRNQNSAYDGGPRNWNQKLEFPTMAAGARMWESKMFTKDQMVAWENKTAAQQTW